MLKRIDMDAAAKFKMVEKIMATEDDALLEEVKSLLGLSERDWIAPALVGWMLWWNH